MDERAYELQAETIKALAHPTRIAILELLRQGETCVCEMCPDLGLAQANVSQHLAILRACNLVATRRDGVRILYRVSDERVFEILELMGAIVYDQLNNARKALAVLQEA